MRVLFVFVTTSSLAIMCGVGSAEPRWAVGLRTTWNMDLHPPAWLLTGGQWGIRVGDRTWLVLDADGAHGNRLLGDGNPGAWRSLLAFNLGVAHDLVVEGNNAVALHTGLGLGWESARIGMNIDEGSTVRPLAFAGVAFERHFPVSAVDHGTIGLELRATRLLGEGPMGTAPPLPVTSAQLTLAITDYF